MEKTITLCYVDSRKFFFLVHGGVLELEIPTDVIENLEVINKEKLYALVAAFLEYHKITPGSILFILSPALSFKKEFPVMPTVDLQKAMETFLEFVPFESVARKDIQLEKGIFLVAVNKNLCDSLKIAMEKQKWIVEGVVPMALVGEVFPQLLGTNDLSVFLPKVEDLKQYSIMTNTQISKIITRDTKKSLSSKRFLMLLSVFGLLILILLGLVYKNSTASQTPPTVNTSNKTSH